MSETLRLDKWLWQARFFKTRRLASEFCKEGKIRIDGLVVAKPHFSVREHMVLTFPLRNHVRVLKILQLGTRRGPAPEARTLYEDLAPIEEQPKISKAEAAPTPRREKGMGRPTKADRRAMTRFKDSSNDW